MCCGLCLNVAGWLLPCIVDTVWEIFCDTLCCCLGLQSIHRSCFNDGQHEETRTHPQVSSSVIAVSNLVQLIRACCTNIIQLSTRFKSEFDPSSAVNCVAPKLFKRWSSFNSELPSDLWSNFDLGSTRGYACALSNKYLLWCYCCKKLSDSNPILSKKLPRIEL